MYWFLKFSAGLFSFLLSVAFQWFLMALSVRPFSSFARAAHLLVWTFWACQHSAGRVLKARVTAGIRAWTREMVSAGLYWATGLYSTSICYLDYHSLFPLAEWRPLDAGTKLVVPPAQQTFLFFSTQLLPQRSILRSRKG